MFAGAHEKFERYQHTEMYLLPLKAQDRGKMELSFVTVSFFPPSCLANKLYLIAIYFTLSCRETVYCFCNFFAKVRCRRSDSE